MTSAEIPHDPNDFVRDGYRVYRSRYNPLIFLYDKLSDEHSVDRALGSTALVSEGEDA